GFDIDQIPAVFRVAQELPDIRYDGTEGELYNLKEDPRQWRNLWSDGGYQKVKSDLVADLYDSLPQPRTTPLPVDAPA
ncbi:MAG TPA: hypothetical protein VEJ86_04755, partial [Candidatus Binataceae bacterium]|nr:hypothetical protein [Candidatus Binataceae bacterium]